MLVNELKKVQEKRVLSFRIDKDVAIEFSMLCKKYGIRQVEVMEKAVKKAIDEIKELEDEN